MSRRLLLVLTCGFFSAAYSQVEISGTVLHEKSRTPLPFVNIVDKESHLGTVSDIEGRFRLTSVAGRTIEFRYIGFETVVIVVPARATTLSIKMREKTTELAELTVHAGANPALRIIRKAIANRESNDPLNLPSFQYHSYNKLSCAL